MLYGTQRNPLGHAPFLCLFYYEMVFTSRKPVDILLYSSTMRWPWNKNSFHICLDYRIENNMKLSKCSSTESPFGLVKEIYALIRAFHTFTDRIIAPGSSRVVSGIIRVVFGITMYTPRRHPAWSLAHWHIRGKIYFPSRSTRMKNYLCNGAQLHKTFCQTFFCHRKTLANLYANCNGIKKFAGVSWVFAVKNSGKSL